MGHCIASRCSATSKQDKNRQCWFRQFSLQVKGLHHEKISIGRCCAFSQLRGSRCRDVMPLEDVALCHWLHARENSTLHILAEHWTFTEQTCLDTRWAIIHYCITFSFKSFDAVRFTEQEKEEEKNPCGALFSLLLMRKCYCHCSTQAAVVTFNNLATASCFISSSTSWLLLLLNVVSCKRHLQGWGISEIDLWNFFFWNGDPGRLEALQGLVAVLSQIN